METNDNLTEIYLKENIHQTISLLISVMKNETRFVSNKISETNESLLNQLNLHLNYINSVMDSFYFSLFFKNLEIFCEHLKITENISKNAIDNFKNINLKNLETIKKKVEKRCEEKLNELLMNAKEKETLC